MKILLLISLFLRNPVVLKNDYKLKEQDKIKIEKAIKKMGPRYQYVVYPDGTLKVKLKGRWLKLKWK